MKNFEYAAPQTEAEAVDLLNDHLQETSILAGGTDLISLMQRDVCAPKRVVDIKQVETMQGITPVDGGYSIGALTSLEDLYDHPLMADYHSLLHVVEETKAIQIQSMGTLGGDLCHLPNCWYYRNGYGLFGEENNRSLVEAGENRYHAILGNAGAAKYVSASRFAPALLAWNSKVRVIGPEPDLEAWIPLDQFYRTPQQEADGITLLKPGQLLTHIWIPSTTNQKSASYEVLQLNGLDWPLAAASSCLQMDGDIVQAARICLGHVAPTPWLAEIAADSLVGQVVNEQTATEAADIALAEATPLSDNDYKVQIAHTAVKRSILRAVGQLEMV